jgi:hypothetical protein
VTIRGCAACSGIFAAYPRQYPDEPYFCPKCTKLRMAGFDPRPNDTVYHVDCQAGPGAVLLVLVRTGDECTVRPLGLPNEPPQRRHVGELVPVSGYSRGAR